MKVLRILVDLNTGENLDCSTIEVDSEKFHSFTLPAEGCWMGEMVGIHYSNDLEVGPTREDMPLFENDLFFGFSPEDFVS